MWTKFKIFSGETNFLDFSRGNPPTRTLWVGVCNIFEILCWGAKNNCVDKLG